MGVWRKEGGVEEGGKEVARKEGRKVSSRVEKKEGGVSRLYREGGRGEGTDAVRERRREENKMERVSMGRITPPHYLLNLNKEWSLILT